MNTLVFCIECQEMVEMKCYPVWGCSHDVFFPVRNEVGEFIGTDVDLCYFPAGYAFVAPPEVDPDWVDHVVEIGEEFVVDEQLDIYKGSYYFDPELPEEAVYLIK